MADDDRGGYTEAEDAGHVGRYVQGPSLPELSKALALGSIGLMARDLFTHRGDVKFGKSEAMRAAPFRALSAVFPLGAIGNYAVQHTAQIHRHFVFRHREIIAAMATAHR